MNVLILAAGAGKRFWPYNEARPKPLFPVSGKPIVCHTIDNLISCGVTKIYLGINNDIDAFSTVLSSNGYRELQDCSIELMSVGETNGPADTLRSMMNSCPRFEEFIVLYGDTLIDKDDLNQLIHCKGNHVGLFRRLREEERSDRIAYNLDCGLNFKYHPRRDSFDHELVALKTSNDLYTAISYGLPSITDYLQCGMMPTSEKYIEPLLSEYLAKHSSLDSIVCTKTCINVDYPWNILEATFVLNALQCDELEQNVIGEHSSISDSAIIRGHLKLGENTHIGDNVIIQGNVVVGDNTTITDGAIIGSNVVIGSNSTIKEYCKVSDHSTIGDHCIIGHGAELEGVILNGTYLYHYCEIFGVLGNSVDIGAGTTFGSLRFDDNKVMHKIHGKRITPSNFSNAVFVGDFVRTGVNSTFMPGVKVGNNSVISANLCLSQNLESNTAAILKQEIIEKSWGPEKYGI